ncbi:hypothetical protein D9M72_360120 [compost metagenome]
MSHVDVHIAQVSEIERFVASQLDHWVPGGQALGAVRDQGAGLLRGLRDVVFEQAGFLALARARGIGRLMPVAKVFDLGDEEGFDQQILRVHRAGSAERGQVLLLLLGGFDHPCKALEAAGLRLHAQRGQFKLDFIHIASREARFGVRLDCLWAEGGEHLAFLVVDECACIEPCDSPDFDGTLGRGAVFAVTGEFAGLDVGVGLGTFHPDKTQVPCHRGGSDFLAVAVHGDDLRALVLRVPGSVVVGDAERCGGDEEAAFLLARANQQRGSQARIQNHRHLLRRVAAIAHRGACVGFVGHGLPRSGTTR